MPVSPQCPQEIVLPILPVFQGAVVSSEHFSQSPPGNVALLGGSLPLRRSLEQLDRPFPAGPPLQGTELAALSIPEASLESSSLSRSSDGAGAPAKCVSGSGSGSTSLAFLGSDAGLRTIVSIEDFSKKCLWLRTLWGGRPLWGRVVHTSVYGVWLSSVPSGDRSVSPATLGASGHSEFLSRLLPGNIAVLSLSLPLKKCLEQLGWPSLTILHFRALS